MKPCYASSLILSVLITLCSCCVHEGRNTSGESNQDKGIREPLIDANKAFVEKEDDRIKSYIKRRKWKMKETGTGLHYMIVQEGDGIKAENGMMAEVNFNVSLLDGTLCYTSDSTGSHIFKVGMDHLESGIHEGITYMKKGGKATFILPHHLAHGLTGDQNRVPPRSTLVYEIELIDLKQ